MIDPVNDKLVRASFSKYDEVLNLFRQFIDIFKTIETKGREVAQSLMGKGKRTNTEIIAAIEGELSGL
jgi:hypothetical protein